MPVHGDEGPLVAAIADASDDAIVVVDLDGTVVLWSRAAEELYGYGAQEIVGRPVFLLVPDGHHHQLTSILERVRDGARQTRVESVARTSGGLIRDLQLSASPVRDATGRVVRVALVARDVARRGPNIDAHAQRTGDIRWRSIIESAVDGIVVIDARGSIESFNPAAERLFGYAEAEVVGRNVSMLMPPPYRDEHDGYLERYLREGTARIIGIGREAQGLRRDGTVFPLHLSVGEMSIDGERKFTGILRDLTARVALEERLRTSEARWRSIIESAVDGIVVIDSRGRIEALNPAAEQLFGYASHELEGRNVSLLMPSPYKEEHDGYLARYLRDGGARVIGVGREVTGLRRDGSTFPLHLSVGELSSGGERKFTGILHDLTARVQMEGRLREQASLARLGEMAAVIAHEVRNPLAGIRGAIQVIASRMPPESRDTMMAREVIARVDTLNELIQDMLLFARPPQPRPAAVDLAPLVTTTVDLLSGDPALKDVRVRIDGTAPVIVADAELLKIVFQNLLINGAHAMKGAGEIQVSLSAAGGGCQVAFADRGPGIPPDIREQIFTPFFTTKARGTGLGLPTARRLVEAHRGTLSIDCPLSGGTTVTIRLPLR